MRSFFTSLFLLFALAGFSQNSAATSDSLRAILIESSKFIVRHPEFEVREKANQRFTKALHAYLATRQGFQDPLDTIKSAIRLSDADNEVVLFTWQMPMEDMSYQRFGVVAAQERKNNIRVTSLEDKMTALGDEATFKYLRPTDWYGAIYYKLIPIKADGETVYTLLGYAPGKDLNRKVVEVLSIDRRGRPRFGKKVFLIEKFQDEVYRKAPMRLILKYSPNHVASLKWNDQEEMIVMDHLSPPDAKFKKQFEKYGPDFSYDGLVWDKGWWNLKEEVRFNSNQNIIIRPPAEPKPEAQNK